MNLFFTLFITYLVIQTESGVMQITLNNLRNVVTTYEELFILFHNPQCIHSRKYVQSFLKIDSSQKLGLVDCLRQIQLCYKYNLTQFPVLAKIDKNDSPQIVDQQQFLVSHELKDGTEDEAIVNKFVRYLQQDPYYAVLVFEDYGLPAMDSERLSESEDRVIYLQPYSEQNPSNFTKLMSRFVNNKPGCWIFQKSSQNHLEKYSCDSGYDKNITTKFISLFKEKKLKKFIFSEEEQSVNPKSIKRYNAEDLYQILKNIKRVDVHICTLIYFSSTNCPSCKAKDIQNIQWVLGSLNLKNQIGLGQFSIDKNQIPSKLVDLGLKRVPELVYFCNQKVKVFGEVFFLKNIRQFLGKNHLEKNEEIQTQQKQTKKNETKHNEEF